MLIEEIKKILPDIKIMILETFVLKASATEEAWDVFHTEVCKRAEKAKATTMGHELIKREWLKAYKSL